VSDICIWTRVTRGRACEHAEIETTAAGLCGESIVYAERFTIAQNTFSRWITFRFIIIIFFFPLKYYTYTWCTHVYNDDNNNSCVLPIPIEKPARGSHTSGGGHPMMRSLIIPRSPPLATVPYTLHIIYYGFVCVCVISLYL